MDKPAHILHLEDDAADAELIQTTLEAAGMACRITVVQTRDQFSEALRKGGYDVILADYKLPGYDGLSAMRLAQELCPDIPFIFVSGTMGEDPAIKALTEGAIDYVLKQKLSRIVPAVRRALREAENRRERKRMEYVLRESEERFRTLAEKSLVGVYIIQDDLFRYVNPAFAEIFGYSPSEIIDKLGPVDFLTAEDRERVLEGIRRRTIGEKELEHLEFHVRRKDGVIRTVEIFGSRALHQGHPAVLGTLIDVTERKKAEEELDRISKRNRLLLESAGEGIFGLDSEGKVTFINPVAAAWLEYDPEELIGKPFHEIIHSRKADGTPYFEEDCPICMTYRDGTIHHTIKDVFWKKDGTAFPVEYTGTPIIENDMPVGAVVTFRDVTEREELEKRLRQAQKMEAIGTLAGGIAHDFNNILGVIIGCTELSLMNMEAGSEVRRYLTEVLNAGDRAKNLVKQILTFSRQRETERKTVQMEIIVKEALKMLRAALPTTIEIRQNISQDPSTVFADPTQIHQVLMNLCTNAAHAMREKGGILEVRLSNLDLDTEKAREHAGLNPGSYVELTVADTGHGMDQLVMEKIFDPYFTTKGPGEGTGLGLAVVHGIIEDYGGAIMVRSEAGKGTTFRVLIPRIDSLDHPQAIEPIVSMLPRGKERILFVDDEEALMRIGKEMLKRLGYEVVARTSSREALEAFRAQPHRFDLVVTDMAMPNMSGRDLAKSLMEIRADIPVILCTGFNEMITSEKARSFGIRALIIKPLDLRGLAETVRKVLDR